MPPFLAPLSFRLSDWAAYRSFRELDGAGLWTIAAASFVPADHVCASVALTHPCLRPANVRRRTWESLRGDPAEIQMVRHVLNVAGLGVQPGT